MGIERESIPRIALYTTRSDSILSTYWPSIALRAAEKVA